MADERVEQVLGDAPSPAQEHVGSAQPHTPGPWHLCYHLESAENDARCPCGYRGGIWGYDEEHIICEMGGTVVLGEEGLAPPRYGRPVELANARLIAAAPELLETARLVAECEIPEGCEHLPDTDIMRFAFTLGEIRAARAVVAKAEGR